MKDKNLRKAIIALSSSRHCETCPLDAPLCRLTSIAVLGEEKCLIMIAINEVLAFHTEEYKKEVKEFRKKQKDTG